MHHANLLIGSRAWGRTRIPDDDSMPGVDVLFYDDEHMSIAHVRSLVYEAQMRPTERTYRTFIIMCDTLLHEAQNALLKLLEEPNSETIFYIIIPREDILLPTLRSRLQMLGVEEEAEATPDFEMFRKAGYSERLKLIQEKLASDNTEWVESLMRGLEVYAHTTRDRTLMREVLDTAKYLHTNGSSKKMLLEHIALTL